MQADPTLYNNKWVYLSPEGKGEQYNGHGMFYWSLLPFFGPEASLIIALEHPDGVFATSNFVDQ